MSGPLQVLAVRFDPGADFRDRFLTEVDRLQGRGVLRVLDVLFVTKREDGTVERMVLAEDDDFGGLLASIVPLGGDALVQTLSGNDPSGFAPVDLWALAECLPLGSALAFLLVEHAWAEPLFEAIGDTGGALLSGGFLTSEAGSAVDAELSILEDAARVIVDAQAAEARAIMAAMAAAADAADAVEASEAIRETAIGSTLQVLITAGLVREAAIHEALEALNAAGLVIAAATAAVEEDAAEVTAAHDAADAAVEKAAARIRAASITTAQARVLRYLPTPLSFAAIAEKLGISRAAARERAERAYKKLGVHSRSDAVNRARELGLLD